MLKLFARGLVVAGGLVLAVSYAGDLHGLGDSLAVFRLWIALGLVIASVFALLLGARQLGFVGLFGTTAAVIPIVLMVFGDTKNGLQSDISVYSKNTLGGRGSDADLVADILASQADIVAFARGECDAQHLRGRFS